ncbi:outer membrane immunogenic protein [Novosphingobium chloroacetimidivorans]|uniref:Outer membrane immunogenic protein n=1 Tax=Novosphingobium chloroacetimidivorans TaxID=1428314 RepID=A0A7W7KAN9_9SPHN|nr:porin family protein [Novosphingobium chloroacetimidivorans]MBB4859317.1 outer membrane immunogenic protein [Novosphingobium chloroacetimidivorans]
MKILIATASLAIAATIAATSPAAAQEAFQGPYAGIEAGWNKNKIDRAETDIGRADVRTSQDSATAGIFAGYNQKVSDRIVLSAEAGFSMGFDDAVTRTTGSTLASIDPEYNFDLGVRAGYLVNDKTLIYARGGYQNLRASVRINDATASRYNKDTFDGWSVGGGVERMLTERVSARLEYRYSDLGGSDTKFERHQVLAGVAYHF